MINSLLLIEPLFVIAGLDQVVKVDINNIVVGRDGVGCIAHLCPSMYQFAGEEVLVAFPTKWAEKATLADEFIKMIAIFQSANGDRFLAIKAALRAKHDFDGSRV